MSACARIERDARKVQVGVVGVVHKVERTLNLCDPISRRACSQVCPRESQLSPSRIGHRLKQVARHAPDQDLRISENSLIPVAFCDRISHALGTVGELLEMLRRAVHAPLGVLQRDDGSRDEEAVVRALGLVEEIVTGLISSCGVVPHFFMWFDNSLPFAQDFIYE